MITFNTSSEIKIRGFILKSKLNWSSHVNYLIKKCSQKLYPLRKLKNYLNHPDLIKIYQTTIRSLIEYGAPAMVGLSKVNSNKLEQIQRRAIRIIFYPQEVPRNLETLQSISSPPTNSPPCTTSSPTASLIQEPSVNPTQEQTGG